MELKLARLIVFAILIESGEGVLGKSPNYILEMWKAVDRSPSLDSLIPLLDPWQQSTWSNYLIVRGKELDGLSAAAEIPEPSEAENVPAEQSEQSESVIKENEK
jgi:hypothetical protein